MKDAGKKENRKSEGDNISKNRLYNPLLDGKFMKEDKEKEPSTGHNKTECIYFYLEKFESRKHERGGYG
jgi:hypothetical protein